MGSRARARFAIKYIAVPAEEKTRAKLLRLWFGKIVEKTPLLTDSRPVVRVASATFRKDDTKRQRTPNLSTT